MKKKDRYEDMLTSNVKFLIFKLSIPTIISMLITSIYNFADTFFVTKVEHSKEAISAVGIIFSFMAIIQAIGFFFGHGSGNYISRLIGEHQIDKAKKYATIGFVLSFSFGLLLTIFGLIFLEPLAKFLTANKDEYVYLYAKDYLFWILLGAPFMTTSNTLNNQLRYQGNAFLAMLAISSGAVLNILLDPILIKQYAVYGAGMSTFVSQILGFGLLYICTTKRDNIHINLKYFTLNKEIIGVIVNGGFPSLARQGLNAVSVAVLNFVAINYSVDSLAAMTVVNRIMSFAISVAIGIGQGFQPVCGINYGAKQYGRVKEGYLFTSFLCTITLLCFALISVFFGGSLIKLFANGNQNLENYDEFMKVGKELLIYQSIGIPLFGVNTATNMMLQTTGKSVRATILAIGRQALFFIPTLFIFQALWGFKGVELAQMVADILCFIVAIPLAISFFKELKIEDKTKEQKKATS